MMGFWWILPIYQLVQDFFHPRHIKNKSSHKTDGTLQPGVFFFCSTPRRPCLKFSAWTQKIFSSCAGICSSMPTRWSAFGFTTTGSLVTEAQLSYQVIQAQAVVSVKWLAHRQDIPVVWSDHWLRWTCWVLLIWVLSCWHMDLAVWKIPINLSMCIKTKSINLD